MAHIGFARCPVIIPYYGGKWELSKQLVPMIPHHERYVEMFAGGLSMYFRKPKCSFNVVNDLDNDIVNLYISVLEKFEEFSKYVVLLPRSRKLFIDFRKEILTTKNEVQIPDARRAAIYYYVIKNSFNRNPYNPFSKSEKKLWSSDLIDEIAWSKKQLDGVVIENLDYRMLVEKYEPKEGDFWYMDPPYVVAGERKDYYFHDFTMDMHNELVNLCNKINTNGGQFMVSYDDREEVRSLFKDYKINEIKCVYAGSSDKKQRTELVITNYEPPKSEQTNLF
tara:strand:- start:20565 stop:21401 length:837 start_codon:yes stop_codon:yes gene_type:complete